MSEAITVEDDGFNVVNTVSPSEWVKIQTDEIGEYVHLIYDEDERKLRCYLSVESNDPEEVNARVKTTLTDVKFRKNTSDGREVEIKHFFLTWTEAMNFINMVEQIVNTAGRSGISMRWDEADGGPMMDDEATSMEALNFTFTTLDGREKMSEIRSEWQHPDHRMADVIGEGY